MKQMQISASRRQRQHLAFRFPFAIVLLFGILLTSCKKQVENQEGETLASQAAPQSESAGNALDGYTGLSATTMWELQQARAATARYRKLDNALKDGYEDIHVHDPRMGHHFMKSTLVDGNFDYRNPEILVYSKDANNNFTLVAVEYAVPRNLSQPSGFTGPGDVWNGAGPFPFWLLHAWVWKYNPDGVFSPMNPDVNSIP